MAISVFDMFKIGIGPSSSHTVGPMKAGSRFLMGLRENALFDKTSKVTVELYGSLALTGIGHGTDKACILGLLGYLPHSIDPDIIEDTLADVNSTKRLSLDNSKLIEFDPKKSIVFFRRKTLPLHPNGMKFIAHDSSFRPIYSRVYYSIGGGFVVNEETAQQDRLKKDRSELPYPFKTAKELLNLCELNSLSISDLMLENENLEKY